MKTHAAFLILFAALLSVSGCTKHSTEAGTTNTNYIPLAVGDVRQIVFLKDSSTVLIKVIGTQKRLDGLDVFTWEETYGVENPDTSWYIIKDGFFSSTKLVRNAQPINPFGEQHLGRVNPVDGETWTHTPGSADSSYFTAGYFKERQTLCGTFMNVYGFTLYEITNGLPDTVLTPFYAENVGYIGTGLGSNLHLDVSASYIKVGNQIYGALWPAKNASSRGFSKRTLTSRLRNQIRASYSLLGVHSTR